MIKREIAEIAVELFKVYPILGITGPRQSGKTTLIKSLFPHLKYASLEDKDLREHATHDPRGFLSNYEDGAILDEVQRVPDLFSYLQTFVDNRNKSSQFVISGSQNFTLMESISQSLAGRIALLKLLPLSQSELIKAKIYPETSEEILFTGCYPGIYDKKIKAEYFFPNYINTYLERDVRNIKNIGNIEVFGRFLKLCAGRVGQPLNYSSLASDTGVSVNTVKSWISILVNSYIVFILPPHYKNFNKRLIKMPKMYFYDTGLLSSLLGIEKHTQLATHYLIGGIFENYVISETIKYYFNRSKKAPVYFWKDNKSKEIDLLIDKFDSVIPIEIKSSKTFNKHDFDNLNYYQKLSGNKLKKFVVSRIEENHNSTYGKLISWKHLENLFKLIT